MARGGVAFILGVLVCSLIATAPALADSVPLPTPAPMPKSTAPGTAPAPNSTPAEPSRSGFFPFSNPFGGGSGSPASTTSFDAKQRALLDKVSLYLSGVQTMVGNFVQIGPDGARTEGTFYLQKPGKVRFEYSPPSPIDVISDGSAVVVLNRKLLTQDVWPLSQTPLRYLLADRIDLLRDTDVVSVSSDDTFVTVVIEEKQVVIGTSRLMIMLGAKDLQLKQWTVTDPQGYDTTVAVYNLDSSRKPDPGLFVINYQRTPGIGNQ
jgi:outer membrane lipoprotein-sorting protein